jgi:hypothetical protein
MMKRKEKMKILTWKLYHNGGETRIDREEEIIEQWNS